MRERGGWVGVADDRELAKQAGSVKSKEKGAKLLNKTLVLYKRLYGANRRKGWFANTYLLIYLIVVDELFLLTKQPLP